MIHAFTLTEAGPVCSPPGRCIISVSLGCFVKHLHILISPLRFDFISLGFMACSAKSLFMKSFFLDRPTTDMGPVYISGNLHACLLV